MSAVASKTTWLFLTAFTDKNTKAQHTGYVL